MNCDYCGKNMPESYSYEVGGVVDCGKCRDLRTPLQKANDRIAELEATRVPDEVVAAISDLKKTFPREEYFGTGGLVRILIKWLDEQEARDE